MGDEQEEDYQHSCVLSSVIFVEDFFLSPFLFLPVFLSFSPLMSMVWKQLPFKSLYPGAHNRWGSPQDGKRRPQRDWEEYQRQ